MTSAAAPARRRPPGRYDQPSRVAQRVLAVLLAVSFVGLVGAVTWTLYQRYGTETIPVQVRGYQVTSDRTVRVDFEVTAPAGRTVFCLVRAKGQDFAEVGRVIVPVVGTGGRLRLQQDVPTTARAVTGEVPLCRSQPPTQESPGPTARPVAP